MAMMPRYPEEGSYTSDTCWCSCCSSSANSAVASSFFALARESAGDDGPLDLAGAFIYLRDLCIPEKFLDGEISHVTIAPEELNRLCRHPHRRLRREHLGHAGVQSDVLAGILAGRRAVRQCPRRFDPRRHIGQLELHRLDLLDRLAELAALGAVLERQLERLARDPDPLGPDPEPSGEIGRAHV